MPDIQVVIIVGAMCVFALSILVWIVASVLQGLVALWKKVNR